MSTITMVDTDLQIKEIVKEFWDDRVGFSKHIVGFVPTHQQAEGMAALDTHDHTVTKSGHGVGKSGKQSNLILHYMSTRPFCKIPCTAPSKHQLHDVLWAELSKWHRNMNPLFRNMFIWTKERFFHKEHPEEWFAAARTATKENPEALQGFHADYIFKVVEEASAVPDEVFEVLEGAYGIYETKEDLNGNPTRLNGHFYEAFAKEQLRELYRRFTWSCLDSPIAPPRYAERIKRKYGIDSNMYRIRVLGEFPLRDGDSYIPYDWAYDTSIRDIIPQDKMPKVFGVDVARYGDDETVIAIRQGDEIKPLHVLTQKSTMETAGAVIRLARDEKPEVIYVDVNGLGAGVYDRLEELGYPVIAINASESPAIDPSRYKRLRDELWGNTRDWLETRRGRFHDNEDGDLVAQLTTPKYKVMSDGKIIIESKDDMKKRGLASPNRADAVNLTFALPINTYSREREEDFEDLYEDDFAPLDREAGY